MESKSCEQFDAIIVGGGLVDLAAAYTLESAGLEVLILERGNSDLDKVTNNRLKRAER